MTSEVSKPHDHLFRACSERKPRRPVCSGHTCRRRSAVSCCGRASSSMRSASVTTACARANPTCCTLWRVNMGQAYQAGVWERGQRSTSHPYLLYRVGPSREHRAQHLAWDGVLLPKDDPFWAVANPRNGWGCKCSIRFVSRAQHRRYVRAGITYPSQGDQPPGRGNLLKPKRRSCSADVTSTSALARHMSGMRVSIPALRTTPAPRASSSCSARSWIRRMRP